MNHRLAPAAAAVVALLCLTSTLSAQLGQSKGKPKANLDLVSSVEKVVPGKAFDIGIRFKLDKGWHIYWQNSGDSGLPPRIKWTLPDGFSAGEIQFPVPEVHVDRFDETTALTTNIIVGDPVLLVRIDVPETVAADKVALKADVQYLICEKNCLRETAELSLELPVAASGSELEPANQAIIEKARARLPDSESKYVLLTPRLTADKLAAGTTLELVVQVDMRDGYAIPSNEPGNSRIRGTHLFVEQTNGLVFEQPIFPEATVRHDKERGKVSEFSDPVVIRVPVEVADDVPPGPVRVGGLLSYQPCKKDGACLPPQAVTFTVTVGAPTVTKIGGADATVPPINAPVASSTDVEAGGIERFGLPMLLLFCFLYGLFINATPCVLPLLSIKVLGFVHQAHESRSRTLALGLAFGAGVMIFFVVLGFLASRGNNVLQYPVVVIALGTVVMALALSMLGVFTLQAPAAASNLEARIQREGPIASFGKGALAPVLGFACTGPLLAGAFGWATRQPPHIAVFAFLAAGLGMASPYMLLGANPKWLSFLPKPGNWMITFERIMGFLLLGMVIWLLNPLVAQIGATGFQWTLVFLVIVAMACWLLGKVDFSMAAALRWRYRGAATAMIAVGALLVYGWIYPLDEATERQRELRTARYADHTDWSTGVPWRAWSQDAVEETVAAGRPVFVDVTAAWCTVCKVNKKMAIEVEETRARMEALGVVPFQADFTTPDEAIADALHRYGRAGPPLNLIYLPGQPDTPIVLEPNLTRTYLISMLEGIGPSRTASVRGS